MNNQLINLDNNSKIFIWKIKYVVKQLEILR